MYVYIKTPVKVPKPLVKYELHLLGNVIHIGNNGSRDAERELRGSSHPHASAGKNPKTQKKTLNENGVGHHIPSHQQGVRGQEYVWRASERAQIGSGV